MLHHLHHLLRHCKQDQFVLDTEIVFGVRIKKETAFAPLVGMEQPVRSHVLQASVCQQNRINSVNVTPMENVNV